MERAAKNEDERNREKIILLKRVFGGILSLKIGKELKEPYCSKFGETGYDSESHYFEEGKAIYKVAEAIADSQLIEFSQKYNDKLSAYSDFLGKYYTYDSAIKELKIESRWPILKEDVEKVYAKHGKAALATIRAILECLDLGFKWDNYLHIQSRAKELGAGKDWRGSLTDLEMTKLVSRHKGDVSISEELIPFAEEIVESWERRPVFVKEKKVKVSKHGVLTDLISAYPSEVFGEKLTLIKKKFRLSSGDEVDLILEDIGGKHLLVEVKPVFEEKATSQILRYKDEYSKEANIPKKMIRIAIVNAKEIDKKFLDVAQELKIEVFRVKISGEKLAT